ncbi:Hypothetical_protein [Hexamita inflata]|uniref:Hypothetical_protein n=1 Tax=Hexamita inflata TaxID=28002 RepID=A0AA86PN59_9EUKA|nr:Hypothetical protein HINF_LOCUS26125 [Hexamita inflata]
MRLRRASTIKSSEKTSEFRFQVFQQASQYLYIHLSELIHISQLAHIDFEKFSFLSRNLVVEEVQNSEIIFQFLEVDCFSDIIINKSGTVYRPVSTFIFINSSILTSPFSEVQFKKYSVPFLSSKLFFS